MNFDTKFLYSRYSLENKKGQKTVVDSSNTEHLMD